VQLARECVEKYERVEQKKKRKEKQTEGSTYRGCGNVSETGLGREDGLSREGARGVRGVGAAAAAAFGRSTFGCHLVTKLKMVFEMRQKKIFVSNVTGVKKKKIIAGC